MTKRKKLTEPPRNGGDLAVRFFDTDAGWLRFEVQPFGELAGTHLNDPFPGMIQWLEAIADGVDLARWMIDYEGGAYQLIFSAAADLWVSSASAQLIFTLGSDEFCGETKSCLVRRRELIDAFYREFRSYVESDYRPEEWERQWPMTGTWEDVSEDEPQWEGERLRQLRSSIIETYLRSPLEQIELIERPKFEWRPVVDD